MRLRNGGTAMLLPAGPQITRGEGYQRKDRPLANGHQDGRCIHGKDEAAHAPQLRGPLSDSGWQAIAAVTPPHLSEPTQRLDNALDRPDSNPRWGVRYRCGL